MIAALARWSIRRRGVVLTCALLLSLLGLWSASRVPIDAMPDITGPQVQVNTALPALAADEAESRAALPNLILEILYSIGSIAPTQGEVP